MHTCEGLWVRDVTLRRSLHECALARAMDVPIESFRPRLFLQTNDKRPIKCEVCQVECANSNMYADHLRGKRHRCVFFSCAAAERTMPVLYAYGCPHARRCMPSQSFIMHATILTCVCVSGSSMQGYDGEAGAAVAQCHESVTTRTSGPSHLGKRLRSSFCHSYSFQPRRQPRCLSNKQHPFAGGELAC